MRITFIERLRSVLQDVNIDPTTRELILLSASRATNKGSKTLIQATGMDWKVLLSKVRNVRTRHVGNRARWTESARPLFAEYESILDRTIKRIQGAQLKGYTVDAYAALVRQEGRVDNGACDAHWPNWIPERVRDDYTRRLNLYYDRIGRTKGSRLRPFTSPEDRAAVRERTQRLHTVIDNIRRAVGTVGLIDGAKTTSDTPRGALYLAAARMAELALNRIERESKEKGTNPTLPVNWRALLTPQMRGRLADADLNPDAVDTADLSHFYVVHPNADNEEQAEIEKRISAIAQRDASDGESNHETAEAEAEESED